MNKKHARLINNKITSFYLVCQGVKSIEELPDLLNISLAKMVKATQIIRNSPPIVHQDGSKTSPLRLTDPVICLVYLESRGHETSLTDQG